VTRGFYLAKKRKVLMKIKSSSLRFQLFLELSKNKSEKEKTPQMRGNLKRLSPDLVNLFSSVEVL